MIAIYSNSKIWGGVEVLVTRFAEYLRTHGLPFCLIEPAGTRLFENLRWVDPIAPSDVNIVSDRISKVFLPSVAKLRDPEFPWKACGGATIFSWIVHPNDPFRSFFPFSGRFLDALGYRGVRWLQRSMPGHASTVQSMFAELLSKKALAVMDGATTRALRYFYPSTSVAPVLIPIPSAPHQEGWVTSAAGSGLSVGYLGRLDDFKYSALCPFVSNQLAARARHESVALHIIAEGPRLASLRKLCRKSTVALHEYGFRPNNIARDVLRKQTQLVAAMGTASLDIAVAAHPCIIIDPAMKRGTRAQARFNFVSEIKQYTLGEYRDFPYYECGAHDFDQIVEMATPDAGIAGRDYVLGEHNPKRIFDLLTDAITGSLLKVSELAPRTKDLEASFQSIRNWLPNGWKSVQPWVGN